MTSSGSTRGRFIGCALPGLIVAACVSSPAVAQDAPAPTAGSRQADVNLGTVPVTADAPAGDGATAASGGLQVPSQSYGPFGALPVLNTPFSTNAFPQELIRDTQARDVGELAANDPSFGVWVPSNASGYPAFSIRGFVSDSSSNNRIDGLPLTSQSGLTLDMFERVDIYKGLFGLLYGFSSRPGGLVNYVTKRPLDQPLTEIKATYQGDSQFGGGVDISRRFGTRDQFGIRVNLSGYGGDTPIDGQRQGNIVAVLAVDWRPLDETRLWGNVSYARNAYHGIQPGLYLADLALPRAPDASTFLGLDFSRHIGRTRGLEGGFETRLAPWLTARGTIGDFRAHRDVRYDDATLLNDQGDYDYGIDPHNKWLLDDLSGELSATATFTTGVLTSATSAALTLNREHINVYTVQDYQDLGTSNLYRPDVISDPNQPTAAEEAYISNQKYRNVAITERLDIGDHVTLIGGVAFSRVSLKSNEAEFYVDEKTTPSFGVVLKPNTRLSVYGSFTRGLQEGSQASDTVGSAPVTNALQYLPPFVSTQYELGSKYQVTDGLLATLALFRISRPIAIYLPTTTAATAYTFTDDGEQVNKGIEFNLAGRITPALKVFGGATFLHARIVRSQDGALDGNRPIGVPKVQANLLAEYDLGSTGLTLIGGVHYKSDTELDAGNTRRAPDYSTIDAGAKYTTALGDQDVTARLYVTNLFDHDYWGSSLFAPVAFLGDPRTVRVELSTRF